MGVPILGEGGSATLEFFPLNPFFSEASLNRPGLEASYPRWSTPGWLLQSLTPGFLPFGNADKETHKYENSVNSLYLYIDYDKMYIYVYHILNHIYAIVFSTTRTSFLSRIQSNRIHPLIALWCYFICDGLFFAFCYFPSCSLKYDYTKLNNPIWCGGRGCFFTPSPLILLLQTISRKGKWQTKIGA